MIDKKFKIELVSAATLLLIVITGIPQATKAATDNFHLLKSLLKNRNNEAKVYIPDRAFIGKKLEIIIDAPGASKVSLLQSMSNGNSTFEEVPLNIGADYKLIGESLTEKNSFIIDIPIEEYTELVNKEIYFDAVAYYETAHGTEKKKANFFGSNAVYSNQNAVRIVAPKKSNAGAESLIRAVAPGLIRPQANY